MEVTEEMFYLHQLLRRNQEIALLRQEVRKLRKQLEELIPTEVPNKEA